jgi:C1A family cysteine protease
VENYQHKKEFSMVCKRRRKGLFPRWAVLPLVPIVFLAGWVFGVPAQGGSQERFPVLSPLNPAFSEQSRSLAQSLPQNLKDKKVRQQLTTEGQRLGWRPSPLDLSHLKEQAKEQAGEQVLFQNRQPLGLPVSYDLRSTGKLTPVKNQGSCGSCWSFATYGSLESNLLPTETQDLSENHLKNTHGFDWDYCDGGNAYISAAYLARWSGPVDEADDPYNPSSGGSPAGLSPTKHIQEILIIPDRSSSSDNAKIKQAVMSYGAVYTSMYWGSYYNSETYAYYFDGWSYSNHAVAIVGWDDDYSKTNFASTPAGNGAFIVRNSWGTAWGEDGYFYISYYDSNIGTENFVFRGAESTTNYSRIYQYDPLGWVTSLGYGSATAWFANIFTAAADEQLSAVGFYTASANSSFELYVYKNATPGPTSGSLAGTVSGTIASAGYHTVSLGSLIFLPSGQDFSIVVKLTTPGYNYPIPIEYPMGNYSSLATANSGESYVSSDGTEWSDLTLSFSDSNVCLKAFTTTLSETVSTPIYLSGPASGATGVSYTYTIGGSSSNVEHTVQYYVDWGDGTNSGWLSAGTTSAAKSWDTAEPYSVMVKARCVDDTDIESDWSDTLNVVISESPYPAVTLLAPDTDPGLPSGSTYRIQWDAPLEAGTFKVLYSTDNGATWRIPPSGTNIATKYYDWTVPTPLNNLKKCRVKVIGYNGTVKVGEDRSFSPFAVEVIRLTSLNGGGTLTPGETKTISWVTNVTKRPVASVKLFYTENNGYTWKLIKTLQSNLGSSSWVVPSVSAPKTKCKVKVVLRDAGGYIVGSDLSDNVFTIDNTI